MNARSLVAPIALGALVVIGCKDATEPPVPLTSDVIPPIVLFNGTGASPNDVAAVESILKAQHLVYSTANSAELGAMSASRLRSYRLLIIPGGNYLVMGNGLTPGTAAKVHDAVQNGLNYLGICAGALLAGDHPANGLNLTSGVRFGFYAAVNRGIHKAAVPITVAGTPTLDQYWEDGPQLTGWGEVVGTYPDGTPAVAHGKCGAGTVVLCGFHPEAPASWRRGMSFRTSVSASHDYAATLVRAALEGTPLAPDRGRAPESQHGSARQMASTDARR